MAGNRLAPGFSESDHPRDEDGKFAAGNSFAVARYDGGKERHDVFAKGDYVRAFINSKTSSHGEIEGVSHARGEAKVGGVWHKFGAIYGAERPILNKLSPTIKMSKAIERANKRHGADDWSAADAVPAHLQSSKR